MFLITRLSITLALIYLQWSCRGSHASSEEADDDGILTLTQGNIMNIMEEYQDDSPSFFLVALYATWCDHNTSNVLSEMISAKERFEASPHDVTLELAKVDVSGQTVLANFFKVDRYVPELRLVVTFKDFDYLVYEYDDNASLATPEELSKFVLHYWARLHHHTPAQAAGGVPGSAVIWRDSPEACEAFANEFILRAEEESDPSCIVFIFYGRSDHSLYLEYDRIATDMVKRTNIALFFVPTSTDDSDNETSWPLIQARHYYPSNSASQNTILYNFTSSLDRFISSQSSPLVLHMQHDNTILKDTISTNPQIKVHVTLFIDAHANNNSTVSAFQNSSLANRKIEDNRSNAIFFIIPRTEQTVVEYFNITSFPTLFITDNRISSSLKKYALPADNDGSISQITMDDFLLKFWRMELNQPRFRVVKSQPVKQSDRNGPVPIIRGNSFQSMVMENPKHVLVFFYSPWCGHAQAALPVLNQLSPLSNSKWMLDVMKMDVMENEVDHDRVNVEVLPTLYFFHLEDKANPVKFGMDMLLLDNIVLWLITEGGFMVEDMEWMEESIIGVDGHQEINAASVGGATVLSEL